MVEENFEIWLSEMPQMDSNCLYGKGQQPHPEMKGGPNPTEEKSIPPCNGNPTLIFENFQPHKVRRYWKIQLAPPLELGGAHYETHTHTYTNTHKHTDTHTHTHFTISWTGSGFHCWNSAQGMATRDC